VNWLQSVSSFVRMSGFIERCGSKCLRDLRFLIAKCHLEKGISIQLKVNSFARTLQINNTLNRWVENSRTSINQATHPDEQEKGRHIVVYRFISV